MHAQHEKWVTATELPVLRVCTEPGSRMEDCVASVKEFVAKLVAEEDRAAAAVAAAAVGGVEDSDAVCAVQGKALGGAAAQVSPPGSSPAKQQVR